MGRSSIGNYRDNHACRQTSRRATMSTKPKDTNPFQPIIVGYNYDYQPYESRYPDFYSCLNDTAKKEFGNLWKLAQSIQSNGDAHKFSGKKVLITTSPLLLSELLKSKPEAFKGVLDDFKLTLEFAYLNGAQLSGAQLSGVSLANAFLWDADLSEANLNGACLAGATLNEASFNGANLKNVYMDKASITGASFIDTQFDERTYLWNLVIGERGIKIKDEKGQEITTNDTRKIKEYFIRQGAKESQISFAEQKETDDDD